MSEQERPRPEYGEYASEEEQASAIERSGAPRPPKRPEPAAPTASDLPGPAWGIGPRTQPRAGAVNRIATVFLLSFGLVYVIGGMSTYLSLGELMGRMFSELGVGDYTTTALTPVIGVAIAVSQGVLWLLAAVWSFVRLRHGRLTWWIPVLGAVLSFAVTAALLGMLLFQDPAFLAFAGNGGGP